MAVYHGAKWGQSIRHSYRLTQTTHRMYKLGYDVKGRARWLRHSCNVISVQDQAFLIPKYWSGPILYTRLSRFQTPIGKEWMSKWLSHYLNLEDKQGLWDLGFLYYTLVPTFEGTNANNLVEKQTHYFKPVHFAPFLPVRQRNFVREEFKLKEEFIYPGSNEGGIARLLTRGNNFF